MRPAPADATTGAGRVGYRRVDGCRGRCIDQLAAAFGARRNAVSRWLSRWPRFGLSGLTEGPRAGRPPKLPEAAQKK